MAAYAMFAQKRRLFQLILSVIFAVVLIGGWLYPLLGYLVPICMVLGIAIGSFKGRFWCGNLCPRGSFLDRIVEKISPHRNAPAFLRRTTFKIGALVFLMTMMVVQIVRVWPDPYKIGFVFVVLLSATTLLGVLLAVFFHQRSWCYFCPVGSMSYWVGMQKNVLTINSEACVECKFCKKVCPMEIAPYAFKSKGTQPVVDNRCTKCGSCVAACPKQALSFKGKA